MFGISLGEILLVLLVAVVVFNPRHLPRVAFSLGVFWHKVSAGIYKLRRELERDLEEYNNVSANKEQDKKVDEPRI